MKNDRAMNMDACEMRDSVAISHLIDLKRFHNSKKDNNKQTKNKANSAIHYSSLDNSISFNRYGFLYTVQTSCSTLCVNDACHVSFVDLLCPKWQLWRLR